MNAPNKQKDLVHEHSFSKSGFIYSEIKTTTGKALMQLPKYHTYENIRNFNSLAI